MLRFQRRGCKLVLWLKRRTLAFVELNTQQQPNACHMLHLHVLRVGACPDCDDHSRVAPSFFHFPAGTSSSEGKLGNVVLGESVASQKKGTRGAQAASLSRQDGEERRTSSPDRTVTHADQQQPFPRDRRLQLTGRRGNGRDSGISTKIGASYDKLSSLEAYKGAEAGTPVQSTVILLTLQDGLVGAEQLQEWAKYVQQQRVELPLIWVVCPEHSTTIKASVEKLAPHFQSFVVKDSSAWSAVLRKFVRKVNLESNLTVAKQTVRVRAKTIR